MDSDEEVLDGQTYYGNIYVEASETEREYDDLVLLTPEERTQLCPISPEEAQMIILFNPIDDQIQSSYYELNLRYQELVSEMEAEKACKRWYDRHSTHEDVVYARRQVMEIKQQIKILEEAKAHGRKRKMDNIPR